LNFASYGLEAPSTKFKVHPLCRFRGNVAGANDFTRRKTCLTAPVPSIMLRLFPIG
jgi:hypothetical protein